MARGAARNVHRTVEHACADKERAGCKGCNGGNEQDVRGVMEVFARKELFNVLFAFGYGAHHLWVYHKKNKIKSK